GTLVLALHHDARWVVRHAHGRGHLVHVLPAGAAGVEDVDADVVPVDVHIHLVHLGHDGNGGRGRVDAPLGLGSGHALHAMDTGLVLRAAGGAAAVDLEDDLAVAARLVRAGVRDLGPPALAFRIALVHAEEVGREEARLVPAGTRTDLHDHVALVRRVL